MVCTNKLCCEAVSLHDCFASRPCAAQALVANKIVSSWMSESAIPVSCSEQEAPKAEAAEPSSSQTAREEQGAGETAQSAAHAAAQDAPAARFPAGPNVPLNHTQEATEEAGQPSEVQLHH